MVYLCSGWGILSDDCKENQPTLYARVFFDDPDAARRVALQKGHGRLETREIWTSTQMNEWFEKDWTGLAQIFRLRRVVPRNTVWHRRSAIKESERIAAWVPCCKNIGASRLPRRDVTGEDAPVRSAESAPQSPVRVRFSAPNLGD